MNKLYLLSVFLAGLLIFGCSGGNGPGKTVEGAVNAVAACNIDALKPYLDSSSISQLDTMTADQKSAYATACKSLGIKITKFEVIKETINGNSATVDYKVCMTAVTQPTETCDTTSTTLTNVGGSWKMGGMPSS
ncbi:Uncharacterised protein [Candidatus Gugararchaeum adminiculabundum]|nr:Uncharacterised protein [Candidatus Gugararchaeum adminiculabundum]